MFLIEKIIFTKADLLDAKKVEAEASTLVFIFIMCFFFSFFYEKLVTLLRRK